MAKGDPIKVDIPDDLAQVEQVVEQAIEAMPMHTRMYPDVYACRVALALAEAGLVLREAGREAGALLDPARPSGGKHGTPYGYSWHRTNKVPIPLDDPCGCRAAHARGRREQRARKEHNARLVQGAQA